MTKPEWRNPKEIRMTIFGFPHLAFFRISGFGVAISS